MLYETAIQSTTTYNAECFHVFFLFYHAQGIPVSWIKGAGSREPPRIAGHAVLLAFLSLGALWHPGPLHSRSQNPGCTHTLQLPVKAPNAHPTL